jgi:hypothetical protein
VSVRGKKWYGYFRRDGSLILKTSEPKTVSTPVALEPENRDDQVRKRARETGTRNQVRLTGTDHRKMGLSRTAASPSVGLSITATCR